MIFIENRKKKIENIKKKYPKAEIIDLTSKAQDEFIRFSPFYPHEDIPIPFTNDHLGSSVEGIWQGLKVFEKKGVDISKFHIKSMKNIKRSVKANGRIIGHNKGVNGNTILDYQTARKVIYLTCYAWVLDNKLQDLIELLKSKALVNDLVFLDYETNFDLANLKQPISHAGLVKLYLEKKHPEIRQIKGSTSSLNNSLPELFNDF